MFGTYIYITNSNLNHLRNCFLLKIILFASHTCQIYQHLLLWVVKTFNTSSHTFLELTLTIWLGMILHHTIWYYQCQFLLGYFNMVVYIFGAHYLCHWLDRTSGIGKIELLCYEPYDPVCFITGLYSFCSKLISNIVIVHTCIIKN